MKIKIFPHMDTDNLEKEVNDFTSDKKVKEIKFMRVGSGRFDEDNELDIHEHAVVIYEED